MVNSGNARDLRGYAIQAVDGTVGKVLEFYFDDVKWAVRYVVVDVGSWLFHKKVLVSPEALGAPDPQRRCIPASITLDQVRRSPPIETDQPIAIQHQALLHAHYGWEMYWGAEALIGTTDPSAFEPRTPVNTGGKPFDPHLRTTSVVTGHRVFSKDGPVGRVHDFRIDFAAWRIHSMSVRTDAGGLMDLPASAIVRISFEQASVYADFSAAAG